MAVTLTHVLNGLEPWVNKTLNTLTEVNRNIVTEFLDQLQLQGRSRHTIESYVRALSTFPTNGKSYREIDADDIGAWLRWLDSNGFSKHTTNTYRRRVKTFLRRIENPNFNELKVVKVRKELPNGVLSKEEVRALIDACDNQRDRALVFLLYETGARPGEILGLRIGDVRFDRYGAVVVVSGKTGGRRLRLIESVPDLQLWLSMHPDRDNPDAPLWPSKRGSKAGIGIATLEWVLSRCARRAGLNRQVKPYLLRHTRATHLANVLTEAQMREYFGWSKTSDVPEVYVHLSGRDVDAALLKHYGVVERGEKDENALSPKQCPRCRRQNPPSAKFCSLCGMPLGVPEAMAAQERLDRSKRVVETLVKWLMDNAPELLERFVQQPEILKELQAQT